MSCSSAEMVRMTTGIRLRSSSPLMSARTSRPSFFGRFRSRRTRSGRGAVECSPSRLRKAKASTPSCTHLRLFLTLASLRASMARRASPELSSTNRISIGIAVVLFILLHLSIWNGEIEGRAFSQLGFYPEASTVSLHEALAECQADACARILVSGVQCLKDDEDAFVVLGVYANAVVPNGEDPLVVLSFGADVNNGRRLSSELDGVAHQVLQDLHELGFIRDHGGQGIVSNHGIGLIDGRLEVGEGLLQHLLPVGLPKGLAPGAHPRV